LQAILGRERLSKKILPLKRQKLLFDTQVRMFPQGRGEQLSRREVESRKEFHRGIALRSGCSVFLLEEAERKEQLWQRA